MLKLFNLIFIRTIHSVARHMHSDQMIKFRGKAMPMEIEQFNLMNRYEKICMETFVRVFDFQTGKNIFQPNPPMLIRN